MNIGNYGILAQAEYFSQRLRERAPGVTKKTIYLYLKEILTGTAGHERCAAPKCQNSQNSRRRATYLGRQRMIEDAFFRRRLAELCNTASAGARDPNIPITASVAELQQQLWFMTGAINKDARAERAPGPDVPLYDAMLVWTAGTTKVAVIHHPDRSGKSGAYDSSVGACFSDWRKKDENARKAQLIIEAWHVVAFYDVPAEVVHRALLVIPEYRDMLSDDCLPRAYRHERD